MGKDQAAPETGGGSGRQAAQQAQMSNLAGAAIY